MTGPHFPSAHDNFDEWLRAYLVTHNISSEITLEDMFSAWVGGAIFAANKMFNPTRPGVPPLPDIFQAAQELPDEPYTSPHYLGGRPYDTNPEDTAHGQSTD
jgi:hypothetical protein